MSTLATELCFDDVTAGYGKIAAIEHLSFTVREGERLGIIGRNGAGKTTTLATAMGLTDRLGGSIRFNGADASGWSTFDRSRSGLGYVPQSRDIFASLTVEENLLSALQRGPARPALDAAYRMFPRLRERRRNGGNQLSGGEQQMLSVARALMGAPRILLLDEPLEGLAPLIRQELMAAISAMSRELGVGCVLVEQQVEVVLDFADSVLVLQRGQVAFAGPSERLREQPELLDRLIGLEQA